MAYSLAISEPVGIIMGIIGGETVSLLAESIAKNQDWNEKQTKAFAIFIGHLGTSLGTKWVINVLTGDVIGAGISPITAIVTAAGHAGYKGFLSPELQKMVKS